MNLKVNVGFILAVVLIAANALAADLQKVPGARPAAVASLASLGRLPGSQRLNLALGLPLRNRAALSNLLEQIYDPASPNYHHYLTAEEFTAQFGPGSRDYEAVAAFARAHHLNVTARHANRVLLDVAGSVADIESALHVELNSYQHPEEGRNFYAPDSDPTLDLSVPLAGISGLDNYERPRPRLVARPLAGVRNATPNAGSGPSGSYLGADFRAAYVPGSVLTGTGQSVGLLQFDGYTAGDITYYETKAGLPAVTLSNVLLDGFGGGPTGSGGEVEVSLDIEMAISMAPGLSGVIVYMAGPDGNWHDILNRMATDNLARQLSCSWYIPGGAADPVADGIFEEMAAQGQSFLNASGDYGAYSGLIPFPGDTPYITQVGGTLLTTSGPGGTRVSETAWNEGDGIATGGGISTQYALPTWQAPVPMTANFGSTTMRNTPDVALTAENVYVRADGSDFNVGGTSCAAPLWAGFTSLMNQQAAANGLPSLGFLNPAIYKLGLSSGYGQAFHDITTGNNGTATHFPAVAGYDLCTGWGTPHGQQLINALVPPDSLVITPAAGFASGGATGGPFTVSSEVFALSNASAGNLTWAVGDPVSWLSASAAGGSLVAGAITNLTVSLNTTASNLAPGIYSANFAVTNVTSNFVHVLPFALTVHDPLVISPTNGFNSVGPVGGPFSVSSINLSLSNSGLSALNWSLSNNMTWLDASLSAGTLAPGTATNLIANLDPSASNLPPALYTGSLLFSDLTSGLSQSLPFSLQTGELPLENGGFELGNFTDWNLMSNTVGMLVTSNAAYVHSGVYGAELGPEGSPGYLSQALATSAGQVYLVSFWLENQGVSALNDFQMDWDGVTVFDAAGVGPFAWTNIQILVGATGTNSELQFGVRNDDGAFGLDDVQVFQSPVTGTPPTITVQPTNEAVTAGLTASFSTGVSGIPPFYYQWQLGGSNIVGATNATLVLSPTTFSEAGSYSLVASNAFGATNSSNAVLTINVPVCDPPPSGLVDWWAGEGNANDSFGTNNGTLVGGVTFTNGEVGEAFSFNGAGAYVDVSTSASLNLTAAVTLEAWIFPKQVLANSQPNSDTPIIKKGGEGLGQNDGYALEMSATPQPTGSNMIDFAVYLGSAGWVFAPNGFVPINQWSHVAGVYNGTNLSIYINGIPMGTVPASGTIVSSGNDLEIGHDPSNPPRYFDGLIDEASIYSTGLSTTQIQAIYSAGSGGKCQSVPVIASQPQSQMVFPGNTVSFAVGAVGTQPLSYQWLVNESNIPAATNAMLTLTNVQVSQSGNLYAVMIRNGAGSTNSSNAVLTVLPLMCDPPPLGLVGWWAGEGNANDSFGTNNGTLVGGVTFTNGEVGETFSFNGTDAYVDVPTSASLNLTAAVTLEAWIFPKQVLANSQPNSDTPIIKKGGEGLGQNDGYALEMSATPQPTGSNMIDFAVYLGSAGWVFAPNGFVPINQWSHVAGVYNGTNLSIYINGIPMGTVPASGTIVSSGNDLEIGHDPSNPPRYFDGLIDEASIYSTGLSTTQIQAIYSAGSGGKCQSVPVIASQPQSQMVFPGNTVSFAVGAVGTQPLSYQWLVNESNIPAATNAMLTLTNVQVSQSGNLYAVMIRNGAGSTNSSNAVLTVLPLMCDPPPLGLVGWWAGEGNANDSFGTNNGTLVGGVTFTNGEVGETFSFNGTDAYVDVPTSASLNLTTAVTLEAWIFPKQVLANGQPNSDTPIIKKGGEGLGQNDGYALEMSATPQPTGSNMIDFAVYLGSAGWVFAPNGFVPINQWSHVAGVYNGTNLSIYINGIPMGTVPASGTIVSSGNDLEIGHDPSNPPRYFDGLIDEASIYSTGLSTTQIQAIYNAGSAGKCEPNARPTITTQPTNQTVPLGTAASFSVGASGTQPLSYQWYANQASIPPAINPTATNATLVLTNVQPGNAGIYYVMVTNSFGNTNSSNAVLTLLFPPSITLQPRSDLASVGCSVAFSSGATGSGTLTYRWQQNGSNLPGQTGTNLALLDIQPTNFGNYTMIASNAYGAATSSVAVLAMDHLPVPGSVIVQRYPNGGIRINAASLPSAATDADGDPISLISVASNSIAGGTVTWSGNSIYYLPPAGQTNADAFNYTLSDGHCSGTSVGTVLVEVRTDTSTASHVIIVEVGDGSVQVIFDGMPGTTYNVQGADTLTPPDWQDVTNLTANQYGTYIYTDWPATNGPVRYFRSVTP